MKIHPYFKDRRFLLLICLIISVVFYLTFNSRQNWDFILPLRGKRVLAFAIISVSSTIGTIVFQTITYNKILSPGIIGLDSLYMLFQTITLFFLGNSALVFVNKEVNFFVSSLLMIVASYLLYWVFFKKFPGRLYFLLISGLIFGTLFRNVTSFFQILMDPNEFNLVQNRLFASFNRVDTSLLIITSITCGATLIWIFRQAHFLNVMRLGRERAMSLGVDVDHLNFYLFTSISVLTALSTALVGPITFLGFLGATLSYRIFNNHTHQHLFIWGSLFTFVFVLVGQIVVEQLFQLETTLSVVLEFVGGIYFIMILLKERK